MVKCHHEYSLAYSSLKQERTNVASSTAVTEVGRKNLIQCSHFTKKEILIHKATKA